jgi:hypothetical protein
MRERSPSKNSPPRSTARVVDRQSPENVSAALEEVLNGRGGLQSRANPASDDSVTQWERRSLTGRLGQIMDGCVRVGAAHHF